MSDSLAPARATNHKSTILLFHSLTQPHSAVQAPACSWPAAGAQLDGPCNKLPASQLTSRDKQVSRSDPKKKRAEWAELCNARVEEKKSLSIGGDLEEKSKKILSIAGKQRAARHPLESRLRSHNVIVMILYTLPRGSSQSARAVGINCMCACFDARAVPSDPQRDGQRHVYYHFLINDKLIQ